MFFLLPLLFLLLVLQLVFGWSSVSNSREAACLCLAPRTIGTAVSQQTHTHSQKKGSSPINEGEDKTRVLIYQLGSLSSSNSLSLDFSLLSLVSHLKRSFYPVHEAQQSEQWPVLGLSLIKGQLELVLLWANRKLCFIRTQRMPCFTQDNRRPCFHGLC